MGLAGPRSIIHPTLCVRILLLLEVVIGWLGDGRFLHILLLKIVTPMVLLTWLFIVGWLVPTSLPLILELLMLLLSLYWLLLLLTLVSRDVQGHVVIRGSFAELVL